MAKTCPIKNTVEWKNLVTLYNGDEIKAYKAYISNSNKIPTLEKMGINSVVNEENSKTQKVVSKYHILYTTKLKSINKLKNRLSIIQYQLKIGKLNNKDLTVEEKVSKRKSMHMLINNIEALEKDLVEIQKLDSLLGVEKEADKDFKELEDIFSKKDISDKDLMYALDKIQLWKKAGDFTEKEHLFFTKEELKAANEHSDPILEEIQQKFIQWSIKATMYENKYHTEVKKLIYKEISDLMNKSKGDLKIDFEAVMEDKNILFSNFIDISEVDNILYQALFHWNEKANFKAHLEAKKIFEDIDDIFDNMPKDISMEEVENLFKQRYSNNDDRHTGNLVYRWTQYFFDTQSKIKNSLNIRLNKIDASKINKERKNRLKSRAISKHMNLLKKNLLVVDVRKLFKDEVVNIDGTDYKLYSKEIFGDNYREFTDDEINEHKNLLIDTLGEKDYEAYIKRTKAQLEMYKEDYTAKLQLLKEQYINDESIIAMEMEAWERKYSPYFNSMYYSEDIVNTKMIVGSNVIYPSDSYIVTIARRYDSKGNDTGFYDKNFDKIQSNEYLYKLYNFILDTLHEMTSYIPSTEINYLQVNNLPEIKKSIIESFMRDGLKKGLVAIYDNLENTIGSNDLTTYSKDITRDINNNKERKLQTTFLINRQNEINDYVKLRTIEYIKGKEEYFKSKKGKKELKSLQDGWRKDKTNELSKLKSWDLKKVLKAYSMMSLSLKHKSSIQDTFQLTANMINNLKEAQLNDAGDVQHGDNGEIVPKEGGLKNLRKMLDTMLDSFYGYNIREVEGKTKKKIYNSKELKTLKEIQEALKVLEEDLADKKISTKHYIKYKSELEIQLKKLGSIKTYSGIGDLFLKYVLMKGLAWNVFSAFANIGFGTIANLVEASGGERFTMKHLRESYGLILNSILRNATFNGVTTDNARKIRSAMEVLDVLKESKNEIFESKDLKLKKRFKWLEPYNGQSRGEYINQGVIMISILKGIKVPGTKMNMWGALDNDGNFSDEVSEDLIYKAHTDIAKAIRRLHGNYDPNAKINIKKTFLGRAFSQFRTWAFMGFYERFGGPTTDYIRDDMVVKGRYKSYASLYNKLGAIEATFEITKQLLRKIAFKNTTFDEIEGINSVDAANLRRNLTEIALLATTLSVALLLKSLAGALKDDDDDDNKIALNLANFWANQMRRLTTDLLFYTSPVEFQKLQRQALPVFTIVLDGYKLIQHVGNLIIGGDDIYHSGIYKDQRKSWRALKNMTPGAVQWNRIESTTKQIY